MSISAKNTVKWSDEILDSLLDWKETNPNFTFWVRKRNNNNRLDDGFWFQGNERYIFVGIYARGSINITQSVGFVVWFDDDLTPYCKIEIITKGEEDQTILNCYQDMMSSLERFEKSGEGHYQYFYESNNILENLELFLNDHLPKLNKVIEEHGLQDDFFITEASFSSAIRKIEAKRREKREQEHKINIILANITWNSKDWKEVSEDTSNHGHVAGGGTPHESWNFDFDNPRNTDNQVYGFAQFSKAPKVSGNNNLVIFYSDNKIVGFYGKAEVFDEHQIISDTESYNLVADKDFSLGLKNKLSDLKEKGYLEEKQRMGQVGFLRLNKIETAIEIIDEAISLNPENETKLKNIQHWLKDSQIDYWVFQANPDKIYRIEDALKANAVSSWKVSQHANEIKNGDKIILRVGGSLQGIYGLGTVTSDVGTFADAPEEVQFYFDPSDAEESQRVKIRIDDNLVHSPIPISLIKEHSVLKSLLGGTSGTNFKATQKQFKAIKELIKHGTMENQNSTLNQILFGPPGTGKTYHTVNEAVKIADPEFYEEHKDDRDKLKERFKLLLLKEDNEAIGQIGFTTFHQSFSYEDFIEGIKPVEPKEDDRYLKYEIQEGIFKRICRIASDSLRAKEIEAKNVMNLTSEDFEKAQFYKISLGNTQLEEDKEIYDYCIENNCITIGFGEGRDLSGMNEKDIRDFGENENLSDDTIRSLNYFKNFLKVGNYVIVSNGNHYLRAIGKVVGDYEFKESPFSDNPTFNHFREIEWILTGDDIPAKDIYYKNFTQKTIYKLEKSGVKKEFFVKGVKSDSMKLPTNPKNYVLVVDEINRGNVSSIFGELITLIEKDKRAGGTEELSVVLPYSKEQFKVPKNVFILGTMNTADRSIEALDTALRRRFAFREMPPKSSLISSESKLKETKGKIGDIDVVQLLDTINNRIEKLIDKDHKIGHSYFMDIESLPDLKYAFKDKVIPLLEEYFFGDYGKIGLVLGGSFITKTAKENVTFADFEEYDSSVANDLSERSVFEIRPISEWDFKSIYKEVE